MHYIKSALAIGILAFTTASLSYADAGWVGDLSPISADEWSQQTASHLLERAAFGGNQKEVMLFTKLGPNKAVKRLVRFKGVSRKDGPDFDHSGVFDAGLDPFPPSRPATTELARTSGEALGVKVKESGNRPIQPVANKFFYWLRASRLETDRVSYWWANRMLNSPRPLEEKMALFWHGHFATNEDKVRDYRKMLMQLQLFQREGLGDFRTLLLGAAQDPAMLAFLDAGINVKGAPNENFAREIMEMFTMGVGHYSETDIREAARAFTGWNFEGLDFQVSEVLHDDAEKVFLGQRGNFDGVDIIDIILEQDVTAQYIAAKLYRYFVRQDLDASLQARLGSQLKALDYNIAAYLEMLFLSRDFYAPASIGTRIKGPVELVVSTYHKAGFSEVPGVPDFNLTTEALGQRLMHPPTVAGWSQGRSWITPSLLFERGNFVLDMVFPDIAFIPPDRYPMYGSPIVTVHKRLKQGMDITNATKPPGKDNAMMAASNLLADRDEAFNTRYASYRGWQMAIERVKSIPRHTARLNLSQEVMQANLKSPQEVVSYFVERFLSVPLDPETLKMLAAFLEKEIGTNDIEGAQSYLEEPLRVLLHVILSRPEYQLG